jgi:hypothetical protein
MILIENVGSPQNEQVRYFIKNFHEPPIKVAEETPTRF